MLTHSFHSAISHPVDNHKELIIANQRTTPGAMPIRAGFAVEPLRVTSAMAKGDPAPRANGFHRAYAPFPMRQRQFIRRNLIGVRFSMAVAWMARRNQILESVVQPVVVKVIYRQRARSDMRSRCPSNDRPAPVAGVRAWTYRAVENEAMLANEPRRRGEWMSRPEACSIWLDRSHLTTVGGI